MKSKTARVATEILNQLGGNKFIAMTGAKNFFCGESKKTRNVFLSFRFPLCKKANHCSIELTPSDTYDVTFSKYNQRTCENKVIQIYTDVYSDMLQSLFKDFTGLETHL